MLKNDKAHVKKASKHLISFAGRLESNELVEMIS